MSDTLQHVALVLSYQPVFTLHGVSNLTVTSKKVVRTPTSRVPVRSMPAAFHLSCSSRLALAATGVTLRVIGGIAWVGLREGDRGVCGPKAESPVFVSSNL
jgi:hypothetical protein